MNEQTTGLTRPTEFMAPTAMAARLSISRPSALQLIEAGLVGPRYTEGQRIMVERQRVEDLAARGPEVEITDLPPALIARVGPPQADTTSDPRDWYGWDETAEKEARRAGVSRWWRVRDAKTLIGRLFVVTVSGFEVDVARIAGARADRNDWAFDLIDAEPSDEEANAWRGIRLRPVKGGTIMRHRLD
jgi:hypothetical protein